MNALSEKVAPQAESWHQPDVIDQSTGELHGEPYLIGAVFIVVNQVENNRR